MPVLLLYPSSPTSVPATLAQPVMNYAVLNPHDAALSIPFPSHSPIYLSIRLLKITPWSASGLFPNLAFHCDAFLLRFVSIPYIFIPMYRA